MEKGVILGASRNMSVEAFARMLRLALSMTPRHAVILTLYKAKTQVMPNLFRHLIYIVYTMQAAHLLGC
jgi:hypothetical protein